MSRCPICERPTEAAAAPARYAPFCSKRCADVDLQRWFAGAYAVPGEAAGDGDAPPAPEGDDED
jgi:endogenous inhibitor of DNA gyrase (YacG/DUF329 family)